jgi:diacylglycerol kinase (ATP)
MKVVKLLHNPKAGDQDHSKKKLIQLIESQGYECYYSSAKKKGWDEIEPGVDFIAIAGGDGTVIKVISKLLKRRLIEKKYPVALLPLGTANNIATALNITQDTKQIIDSWKNGLLKKFDIGTISGIENSCFIESLGLGVFPATINRMKQFDGKLQGDAQKKIRTALKVFQDVANGYKAKNCKLLVDGIDHSGRFLMLEIMNTTAIGPNITINPAADTGDGVFEVLIVSADEREKLDKYLSEKINGTDVPFGFKLLKAKKIHIVWEGTNLHVDDEFVKTTRPVKIDIELRAGLFDFMVPAPET